MQNAVDLATNRFRGGLSSELVVKQAENLLNQTQTQAQALDVQRSQLEHAIAVLEGKAASDFSLPRSPLNGLPVYRQSLAQYEKTVLTAYQEVGDQLAVLRILTGEAQCVDRRLMFIPNLGGSGWPACPTTPVPKSSEIYSLFV